MRSRIRTGGFWSAFTALLLIPTQGHAAEASSEKARSTAEAVKQVIERKSKSVQLVTFPETEWSPVKVARGSVSIVLG